MLTAMPYHCCLGWRHAMNCKLPGNHFEICQGSYHRLSKVPKVQQTALELRNVVPCRVDLSNSTGDMSEAWGPQRRGGQRQHSSATDLDAVRGHRGLQLRHCAQRAGLQARYQPRRRLHSAISVRVVI